MSQENETSNAPSNNDEGVQDTTATERGQTSSFQHVDESAFSQDAPLTPTTEPAPAHKTLALPEIEELQRPAAEITPIAAAAQQAAAPAPAPAPAPSTLSKIVAATPAEDAPKAVVEQTKPEVQVSEFDTAIGSLRTGGNTFEVGLISALDKYVANMKPGRPIEGQFGVNQQYTLFRTLFRIVEDTPALEFNKLWNIVVMYFKEHKKGVFGPRFVMRFTEHWSKDKDDLNAFLNLCNILLATVENKATVKKIVNLDRALDKPITEVGRGRLLTFYK